MLKRQFGQSGVEASVVGFGVWTVSMPWWGIKDREFGKRLLQMAWDRGYTLFDTADTYGNGDGEVILADALGENLKRATVSTKFGYDWMGTPAEARKGQQELPQNFNPDFVTTALEGSLKRLGREAIDLYQAHNPKMSAIERDDLFALLEKFKREGKVRAYGVSIGPAIGWEAEGVAALKKRKMDCMMVIHNLLEQKPGRSFIAEAKQSGCSLMARVPHSSGMLEGMYNKDTKFDSTDHRSHRKKVWLEQGLQKVEQLGFLTEGKDRSLSQVALQYLLGIPEMASTLPNIYNEAQIEEFAKAGEMAPLTAEEMKRVDALFDANYGLPEDLSAEKVALAQA
jgi:aryl-alcohol dehydrogenase-like predicted oxidoreductase